ncbi:DUF2922 domain-containing protein [Clostridium weizhouense]|uniref:DUF2922 domain-containing protein n=1 Tax=Clostridium weizhouense TaxID=2859781 RepID=A0ABS7ASN9_9CLOT|nr:DUF2922 domain-containing protein [Clostridium weizhouense]MBW6411697.1 DUF2922 domain-containing protein [Clostridium weizhouense]
MEYILVITFLTQTGKKISLTINGVKEDIKDEDVQSLMNLIIEKKAFFVNGGLLEKIYSAQLTQREIRKFNVA